MGSAVTAVLAAACPFIYLCFARFHINFCNFIIELGFCMEPDV
jgi:hypothetical protein